MVFLDALERLTKIVFGTILTAVIGWAGVNVNWAKLGLERGNFCFEKTDAIDKALSRPDDVIPAVLINIYSESCGLSQAQSTALLAAIRSGVQSSETPPIFTASGVGPADVPFGSTPAASVAVADTGYVALGRISPAVFSDVNFDTADGRPAIAQGVTPKPGDVLNPRWSVNLRQNFSLTTAGRNAILSVLDTGDCVKVVDDPKERAGQYWAKVENTACSGG